MLCNGSSGFEVASGGNYDFNREFSIAMTFSTSNVDTKQGLLYKGTASDITTSQLDMSYRVGIVGGNVTLELHDGVGNLQTFTGPKIAKDTFFELIIVKHTTVQGNDSSAPYQSPIDSSDFSTLAKSGMSANATVPKGSGTLSVDSPGLPGDGANTRTGKFLTALATATTTTTTYSVSISVRTVNDDGTFGDWSNQPPITTTIQNSSDPAALLHSTGAAHLLLGQMFDDSATGFSLSGNIRNAYLFNSAIGTNGIVTRNGTVWISDASTSDLQKAGLVGAWVATYDPTGTVTNLVDPQSPAVTMNKSVAFLSPLSGREREGAALYVNGEAMTLSLVTKKIPSSLGNASGSWLQLDAGRYRLAEICMWQVARQPYQVLDDMFGRLVPDPTLSLYISGTKPAPLLDTPLLPMNAYIDNLQVTNEAASPVTLSNASLDLAGPPNVAACGPLITPSLYTPPGVALTVCDTPPSLTTYSVTFNTTTARSPARSTKPTSTSRTRSSCSMPARRSAIAR